MDEEKLGYFQENWASNTGHSMSKLQYGILSLEMDRKILSVGRIVLLGLLILATALWVWSRFSAEAVLLMRSFTLTMYVSAFVGLVLSAFFFRSMYSSAQDIAREFWSDFEFSGLRRRLQDDPELDPKSAYENVSQMTARSHAKGDGVERDVALVTWGTACRFFDPEMTGVGRTY